MGRLRATTFEDTKRRPRLLYVAMYDPAAQDSAPKVRIRLLGDALARISDLDTVMGDRVGRVLPSLAWLVKGRMGRIDGVYVEAPSSTLTPLDLAFLALARLRGRPVGVYFRDAYQLYRGLYPLNRRRQILADLAWRLSMPLARAIATVHFVPSKGLASALGIRRPVLLPPGTDPSLPQLSVGQAPIVGYVGTIGAGEGFDRLLAAMNLVRRQIPDATVRAVGNPTGVGLPVWIDARPGTRSEIAERLDGVRVCVVPRPINAYTDLAMPVKVMDYLSYGMPIVATSAAETAAFLAETGAALLVPDDPQSIAGAIVRVLSEPGLAETMGRRAAAYARRPQVTWNDRAQMVMTALLAASGHRSNPGGGPVTISRIP